MRIIYLAHCFAKKDDSLKGTKKKVTPDELYTSRRIQSFIKKCKEKGVEWAIFSDNMVFGFRIPCTNGTKKAQMRLQILMPLASQKIKFMQSLAKNGYL